MPHNLFKSEDAFATSMITVLIDTFGTECVGWTPTTILMEIEDHFHVIPKQGNIDRLMAAIALLTSNSFYVSLPDFNDLCLVLSGEHATPGVFVPCDAAAIAWGVTEAMLLSPPDDMDNAFTEEIRAFIGAVLKDEGILSPPDVLKIAHIDKGLMTRITEDYSEDPELFSGIFKAEQDKTDDINYFIKTRLSAMVHQLGSLPIKNGNVEQVAEMMLKSLPEPSESEAL